MIFFLLTVFVIVFADTDAVAATTIVLYIDVFVINVVVVFAVDDDYNVEEATDAAFTLYILLLAFYVLLMLLFVPLQRMRMMTVMDSVM